MTQPPVEATAEQLEALRIARSMVEAGIPIFAAAPCPDGCRTKGHGERTEFHKPIAWQKIKPSMKQLERWKPGWALAAIGGHAADFLDQDDHHGGDVSVKELRERGGMPRVFGVQTTPSGGKHYVVSPLGEARAADIMPGLDYQGGRIGGEEDGEGRAFVWLAPTVKRSKNVEDAGALGTYQWIEPPDLELLAEFAGSDDSGQHVRDLVVAKHAPRTAAATAAEPVAAAVTDDPFVTSSQVAVAGAVSAVRRFTIESAWEFVQPALRDVREAVVGGIEENANRAAVMLSHFVPAFMSAGEAMSILLGELKHTAYDPNGPSDWTAEKFAGVLDGSRPPRDNWKAEKVEADTFVGKAAETAASGDAVEALMAELLSASEVAEREPPKPLVKGLLNLDSESWIIGEPGSKKSFVATDIAAHVALGRSWQGMKVTQGRVIMIVAEGAGGMGPRLKAWSAEHGEQLPDKPMFAILPRPVQSADAGAWKVLVEVCRRIGPLLVVVDTQARVTVGLDENSAKEMGVYINAVSAIREATGACVLSVHHTGRKGGDARGSSAIDGAQTTELKVESTNGKLAGTLFTEKQKDIESLKPMPLVFRKHTVGMDADGADVTSLALANAPDSFEAAAGEEAAPDPGQAVTVAEPAAAAWTVVGVELNATMQMRALQMLLDVAGTDGITEPRAMAIVAERWHGGQVGRKPGSLNKQAWQKAWGKVLELEHGGEQVVVRGSNSTRFTVNPLVAGLVNQGLQQGCHETTP